MEKQAQADAAAGIRWDTSRLETHVCNLATATSAQDRVVFSFGAAMVAGEDGAHAVRLLGRVSLPPVAAKHLHDMLSRLVAEHDTFLHQPK
jgi:hypothetical protein